MRGEAGGGSLRQPEAAYRPPQATALLLRKDARKKCDEEEERAVILISVGVSVLVIVGIIVGVSCYCKKARNIAPSGTVQGVAMPAQPGVQSQPQPAVQSQPQQQGKAAQLKELKELLDAGALTQDEFDSQKKEVLAGKS